MNCFLLKNKLKVKVYITCYIPKGLSYPSTNPAWQSLTSLNKQGKGTGRMLWTGTKIKVPINDSKITKRVDFYTCLVLYHEIGLNSIIHMTYNHTQLLKKEKSQSHTVALERDNSKPRRGSFLNYSWTSSIHAVCFCNCYFNFHLRNPRKAYTVSAPQEEKQSKKLTSCGPAFGRFRSGKTTWKGNSSKSRSKKKIIRKRDENTIFTCHWSTDKHKQSSVITAGKYTKKAVSQVPDNKNY